MERKVNDQFLCVICLDIAKGAYETSCCHQICCQECKVKFPKRDPCPMCRSPNFEFLISHLLRRIIENLTGIKSSSDKPETNLPGIKLFSDKPEEINLNHNKDGVPIFTSYDNAHQQKIMIYCGRIIGQSGYKNPCGSCDGRCGPTNGCQCIACFELQSKFTAKTNRNGNKVHISFDKYHGKKLKYYCGVTRDNYCEDCDHRCGPTDGCQCSACAELLD